MTRMEGSFWREPGTASQYPDRALIGKVVALLGATRIQGGTLLIIFPVIPILDPFEDVPCHVIESIATHAFGIGIDGGRTANVLAIVGFLLVERMAPWIMVVALRTFGRSLPFCFRRKTLDRKSVE